MCNQKEVREEIKPLRFDQIKTSDIDVTLSNHAVTVCNQRDIREEISLLCVDKLLIMLSPGVTSL